MAFRRTFTVMATLKVDGNIPDTVFRGMARLGGSWLKNNGVYFFQVPLDKVDAARKVLYQELFTEVK